MDTATSVADSGPAINTRSDVPGYLGPDVLRRGAEEIDRLRVRIRQLEQKEVAYDALLRLIEFIPQRPMSSNSDQLSMAYALKRAATEMQQERCKHESVSTEMNHGMIKGTICDDCGKMLSEEPERSAEDLREHFRPPMAYHGAQPSKAAIDAMVRGENLGGDTPTSTDPNEACFGVERP